MVPAGEITENVLQSLLPLLDQGDIVIDGGNAHYKDTLRRNRLFAEKGISYLDCGTSGGVDGARNGVCAMVGGDAQAFSKVEKIFRDISVENGYLYTGNPGAGIS